MLEAAFAILIRPARRLHNTIEGEEGADDELAHVSGLSVSAQPPRRAARRRRLLGRTEIGQQPEEGRRRAAEKNDSHTISSRCCIVNSAGWCRSVRLLSG